MRLAAVSNGLACSILLGLTACLGDPMVGGICAYESFEREAEVLRVELQNGSVDEVEFMLDDSVHVTLDSWELQDQRVLDFDLQILKTKTRGYVLSGTRITKGSCNPIRVSKVEIIE